MMELRLLDRVLQDQVVTVDPRDDGVYLVAGLLDLTAEREVQDDTDMTKIKEYLAADLADQVLSVCSYLRETGVQAPEGR